MERRLYYNFHQFNQPLVRRCSLVAPFLTARMKCVLLLQHGAKRRGPRVEAQSVDDGGDEEVNEEEVEKVAE